VIYSAYYPMKTHPPLIGVSNGSRLLMLHSPNDVARFWQKRADKLRRDTFELGVNVAIYGSGRRELRNRVESLVIPEPVEQPIGTVPVARLRYSGNWDPEPGAWRRFCKSFENDTRIHADLVPIDVANLRIEAAPLAVITGTDMIRVSSDELDALRTFVTKGGVLFIDACGGSKSFADSVRSNILNKLLPGASASPLQSDHPILVGSGEGMEKILPLKVRTYVVQVLGDKTPPPMLSLKLGDGQVIFSDLDVSSGLLGTATWGIVGYLPPTSLGIAKNLLLWSMRPPPR
jgi:hypothetical protein